MELAELIKLVLKNPLMENGQSLHVDIDFTMPDDMSVSITPTATQEAPKNEVVEDVQLANEISSLQQLVNATCPNHQFKSNFLEYCKNEHINTLDELKLRRDDIFNPQKHGDTTRKYLQDIYMILVGSEDDQTLPDVPSLDKICDMEALKKIEDKIGHLPVLFIMESALGKYRESNDIYASLYVGCKGVFGEPQSRKDLAVMFDCSGQTISNHVDVIDRIIWNGEKGSRKITNITCPASLHLIMKKENWEYLMEYVDKGVIDKAALEREKCTLRPEYVIACLKRFFPKDERLEKPGPEKKLTRYEMIEKIMRQYHDEYLDGKHEAKISSQDLFARCQEAYPGKFKNERSVRDALTGNQGGSVVYHSAGTPSILWAEDAKYKQMEFRACIVECIENSDKPLSQDEISLLLENDFYVLPKSLGTYLSDHLKSQIVVYVGQKQNEKLFGSMKKDYGNDYHLKIDDNRDRMELIYDAFVKREGREPLSNADSKLESVIYDWKHAQD